MKFTWVLLAGIFLIGCGKNSLTKVLKNPDPAYKLRIAEQYMTNFGELAKTGLPGSVARAGVAEPRCASA